MANTGNVALTVAANVIPFTQGMTQLRIVSKETADEVKETFTEMGESIGDVFAELGAPLAAGLSVAGIAELANDFEELEQRVKAATAATGDFEQVNQALMQISQANGVALQDTVSQFQTLQRAAQDLGASSTQVEKLVSEIQQLGSIAGQSQGQVDSVMQTVARTLETSTVNAREMTSIWKEQPELFQQIADSIGVTNESLVNMAKNGQLTNQMVFQAMLDSSDQVQKKFDDLDQGMQSSFNRMQNSAMAFADELNKVIPITTMVKGAVDLIAQSVQGLQQRIKDNGDTTIEIYGKQISLSTLWAAETEAVKGEFTLLGIEFKNAFANNSVQATMAEVSAAEADIKQKILDIVNGVKQENDQHDQTKTKIDAINKSAETLAANQAKALASFITNQENANKYLQMQLDGQTQQIPVVKALDDATKAYGKSLSDVATAQVMANAQQNEQLKDANGIQQYLQQKQQEIELLRAKVVGEQDDQKVQNDLLQLQQKFGPLNETQMAQFQGLAAAYEKVNQDLKDGKDIYEANAEMQEAVTEAARDWQKAIIETDTPQQKYLANLQKINDEGALLDKTQEEIADQVTALTKAYQTSDPTIQKFLNTSQQASTEVQKLITTTQFAGDGFTKYTQQTDDLNAALAAGNITQAQFNTGLANAKLNLFNAIPAAQQMGQAFSSAFGDMITGANNFSTTLENLVKQIINIAAQNFLIQPFVNGVGKLLSGSLAGLLGGSSGTVPTATGSPSWLTTAGQSSSLFGFASGGRPPTNQPSWVGEDGREMFWPDSAGTIIPANQFQGAGNGVNVQVNNYTDGTAKQSQKKNSDGTITQIIDIVKDEVSRDITNGGKVGQAISNKYGTKGVLVRR